MLVFVSSGLDPKRPLSGANLESCTNFHVVPAGLMYQKGCQKERVTADTWRSITRLPPVGWGSLAMEMGKLIVSPQAGETYQPWLATHLGEETST